ncbi:hypothetical protein LTR85_009639 [Meristemomyces frigidus]|nr:hypothetical protein LTR85_009639 [Meristemomyces frigidus]
MDSEDGQVFVKASNLAYFVRTHERALANALQLQRSKHGNQHATAGASAASSSTSISLTEALSRPFTSHNIKPAKLALTPHHLFYLLSKFEDLGVDVGPTNVRLENLHSDAAPSNYVSFLGHAPKSRGRQSDADSLRSVSSVRSVMSSVSSLWSTFSLSTSAAKEEKRMVQHRDDIKYLYSCFTKIPALKLSPDHRARLIEGYEEFPFDTAVPLFAFKNLSALEICDLDFRQFHGWDRLAEQLRSLTVKRAGVDDPIDLLQNIVLDDMERRRNRSSKTHVPTTPSTPGFPWPSSSPKTKQLELARSYSTPNSPIVDQRRGSLGSPLARGGSSDGTKTPVPHSRQRSNSPVRPPSSRHGSLHKSRRSIAPVYRRSSGSSGSESHEMTPRHSVSDLLALGILPSSKWRFLRHLSLAENGLTSLTVEGLKPVANTLQSLDLSGNLFAEVPDALASLTHLRALNLSNCMIDSLQSLSRYPLPAITTLNLRSNRLLSLAGIEKIRTLERVDLRDNKLYDPTELRRLTGALELVDLYVAKNPFTRSHGDYRVVIFNAFRDTPGHQAQLTIDTLGPTYNEKRQLHDKAQEPSPVPVVQPPPEDEETPEASAGADMDLAEVEPSAIEQQENPAVQYGHRRSTSDMGPSLSTRRRKRGPRRRIVELSQQQELLSSSPMEPSLLHSAEIPPPTPTDPDEPTTPGPTPYHTAPTTQAQTDMLRRPTLDTAFTSPTPAPKIRDPSDDDDSPVQSPQGVESNTDIYRQKIEALKSELGPNWLSAMNEDRYAEQQERDRSSFSPGSRTPNVRPDKQSRGVSVGGRTLG